MIKYWFYFIQYYFSTLFNIVWFKNTTVEKLYRADMFALLMHHKITQRYDGKPYFYHVKDVALNACMYKDLLQNEEEMYLTYVGALLHDAIEDCNLTYNDIKATWGVEIAEIVYACTELRGKNRKERHGQEYIDTLVASRLGTFVKLCDILSNVHRSFTTGHRMLNAYKKEFPKVKEQLYREEFDIIFSDIEKYLSK